MSNYNFYPGPSFIYPQAKEWIDETFDSGILSMNHRSDEFMQMLKACIQDLKKHLNIPTNYEVYFTSSATEGWEILSQSLLSNDVHFMYNGAFGKKWFKYATLSEGNRFNIRGSRFGLNDSILGIETDAQTNFYCLTSNETSNGTQVSNEEIFILKHEHLDAFICLDATSNLGGYAINFDDIDACIASSQKCFGLPSGLGILILSPRAIEHAMAVNERNHYNSLLFMKENFDKFQTHYTPNILLIYLLGKLMSSIDNVLVTSKKIKERANKLESVLSAKYEFLSNNHRSQTVLSLYCSDPESLMKSANKRISLGKGYGEWRNNSFRIANFPAIPDQHYDHLIHFLNSYEHAF